MLCDSTSDGQDVLTADVGVFPRYLSDQNQNQFFPIGEKDDSLDSSDQVILRRAFCQAVRQRKSKAKEYYLKRSFLDDKEFFSDRIRTVIVIAVLMAAWAGVLTIFSGVHLRHKVMML